jgi:hypothetical protein
MNTVFQPTANCQFTICLTQGVHPTQSSSPTRSLFKVSRLLSASSAENPFAYYLARIR